MPFERRSLASVSMFHVSLQQFVLWNQGDMLPTGITWYHIVHVEFGGRVVGRHPLG